MKNIYFLTFLIFPALLTLQSGNQIFARAEEDELEDESVDVDTEDTQVVGDDLVTEELGSKSSPDVDLTILFTNPLLNAESQLEIAAGRVVEFFVGFSNSGKDEFVVETLDASFRYPMDFSFYIQNFSAIAYNKEVKAAQQATFAYSFLPSEAFAGRPFGLSINLNYRDVNGNYFQEAVYNQTVNVVEVNEGLDGETFFLYVFLGAVVVLILVAGQQGLSSLAKKRSPRAQTKSQIETGTSNANVDFEWLPHQMQKELNKSPQATKQSPRLRKAKRSVGSDD